VLISLLLAASCGDDDDEAADNSDPTSEATTVDSDTTVPTTTIVPSNLPTTSRVTTAVPSTLGASTSVPPTERGSTLAPPTAGASTTLGSNFAPVPEAPPPDEPVHDGGLSATELAVVQTCDPASPASPAVVLTWRPAAAGTQLVAIAVLPDGFETGRYTVTNELPAEQASYSISPVQPGGVYRWRVLTRTAEDWTASEIAEFTGPTCILDTPSPP
jgi:hypothetical protein